MHMVPKAREFRKDIAILRAVAVMLVLFGHFGIPGFSFGFIGVDIFFVISGFLITRILYKEYLSSDSGKGNTASLSLFTFYLRRIRRLMPAAVTVIIAVNIVSFFLYNAETRNNLLSNTQWALFFLANVAFLRNGSDYFQQSTEPSMLQHYWSLSIEEQFYFIWPLVFLIAANYHKLRIRNKYFRFHFRLITLFGIISLFSLLFLVRGFSSTPLQVYFSIFTRAWELGLGGFFGVLAFHKRPSTQFSPLERKFPLLVGLAISLAFIDEKNWAYLIWIPVISTGFFLYAGQNNDQSSKESNLLNITIRKTLIYLGTISYSLYLVHWPIFIIASHESLLTNNFFRALLVPVSILAAHFLWKYVEMPFQKIPLPEKSMWDKKAFIFIKARRKFVSTLVFIVIGSLYLVTYPQAAGGVFSSDISINEIAKDPNFKAFADYESQLTSGATSNSNMGTSGFVQNDSGTSVNPLDSKDLTTLLAENQSILQAGLSEIKLSEAQVSLIPNLTQDESAFDFSSCPRLDTEVPPNCSSRGSRTSAKKVALIGDSKMAMLAQPLIDYFSKLGYSVKPMVLDGCHLSAPSNDFQKNCQSRSNWVVNELTSTHYDVVVSAEYPSGISDLPKINDYFGKIIKNSGKVIILGQIPRIVDPKDCLTPKSTLPITCLDINKTELLSWHITTQYFAKLASTANVKFIKSYNWFCIKEQCPMVVDGVFTTRDGSHLTYTWVRRIAPILNASLDAALQ